MECAKECAVISRLIQAKYSKKTKRTKQGLNFAISLVVQIHQRRGFTINISSIGTDNCEKTADQDRFALK